MKHLANRFAMALFIACVIFTPLSAFAQDDGPEITRADLATSYLRLEMALKDVELDDAETTWVNKAFDSATLAFFGGKLGEAIEQIDGITAALSSGEVDRTIAIPASLRISIDPQVYRLDSEAPAVLKIENLYAYANEEESAPISVWIGSETEPLFKMDTSVKQLAGEGSITDLPVSKLDLSAGRYTIYASLGDLGGPIEVGRWSVVAESLDAVAARNSEKLMSITVDTPPLEQALASCRARNALLSDNPSPENTAQLLFEPNQLTAEIAEEIVAIARGENPYAGREGDFWRVLKVDSKESPMRVYLPESADTSKPLPLVVAFHGAGGDENMFMDAYGAGVIKETADKHGFLLVTPRTYDYGGKTIGEMFDALLEAIGHDYNIDGKRIYVLGHSMGGGATNNLVNVRPTLIAAAAPLCGFRALTTSAEETPPTLVVAAEHDPLARPGRVEPGATKAIEAGLPVEYKLMKNYGHTLVVGDIMHETIEWLLQHERE